MFSFNTKLRAKKIATLCNGDAYEADGPVRDAFVLQQSQTKGARTRTVFIDQKPQEHVRSIQSTLNQLRAIHAIVHQSEGRPYQRQHNVPVVSECVLRLWP